MRFLSRLVFCVLFLVTLAAAESLILQPGAEGEDAQIDNQQGGTPHGSYPYLLMPVGG